MDVTGMYTSSGRPLVYPVDAAEADGVPATSSFGRHFQAALAPIVRPLLRGVRRQRLAIRRCISGFCSYTVLKDCSVKFSVGPKAAVKVPGHCKSSYAREELSHLPASEIVGITFS
ncbi:hypothetical protein R1flu_020887 [Riccia fluitans]|uniref:Uncharacterized protein n=1 Tax=Riccia fluitans TaxID=41844 RepID=A0ABD1ZRH5_9MARC